MKQLITFLILVASALNSSAQTKVLVKIHSIEGYPEKSLPLVEKARDALERVINSEEFRKEIMKSSFIRTNGRTNSELYDKIILAHEQYGPGGSDYVIDLRVRTLRINEDERKWKKKCEPGSRSGTIGIDGNGDGITAICPQRLEKWTDEGDYASLAGHYAHEYMHILGFGHHRRLFNTDRWRQKTFVYKVGNIVNELAEKD